MHKLLLSLIFLFSGCLTALNAQFCLQQGITFSTQAEIDQFALDYPDCKQIMGTVYVTGPDITNLNGLSGVTSYGQSLYIHDNPLLTSLQGLNQVHTIGAGGIIGSLYVTDNPLLINLEGLNNLSYIEDRLDISNNAGLLSLNGLEKLQTIGSNFYLQLNDQLGSIQALGNLETIGGDFYLEDCGQLLSLDGLEKLIQIGGSFYIQFNPLLEDITGIAPALKVGDYWVFSFNEALNACGIEALCRVVENAPEKILQCANGPDCTGIPDLQIQCGLLAEKTPTKPEEQSFLAPNPADKEVFVPLSWANGQLYLYNLQGMLQKQILLQSSRRVDVHDLPAGVYMACWQGPDGQRRVDRLMRK